MNYIGLLVLSLLIASCHWGGSSSKKLPVVEVVAPLVQEQPLVLHFIGITKSVRSVNIKARVDGYLEERYFKDGDFIHQNQLLYRIDERPFQARLLIARGTVDKAKANLVFQEIQYKRYQTMVAKQAVSRAAFDQQYATYLSAKGQLESAEGAYEQAKIDLDYCKIHSPMDGLAGKNLLDPGNLITVNANVNLLNIVQLDPIRVEFNPASHDLKWFYQFQRYNPYPVVIHIPKYPQHHWNGVLDFYNNVITLNTSTMLLRATVANKPMLLRPDLYVDVDVTLNPKFKSVLIPVTQLKKIQGVYQVMVVDKTSHLSIRQVIPGQIKRDMIEVLSGLKAGDFIAIHPGSMPMGTAVQVKILNKKK